MSSSLHRFTPPTCTLEIKGIKSPLSRWINQELLKKFRFQLSFDDPRLLASQQVTIKGDKKELEELKTAVDFYVQNQLHASLSAASHSTHPPANLLKPHLKRDGLVNHQLLFGKLKSDAKTNMVRLTTVQLFDLVTALEAYGAQIKALPTLQQRKANKVIPLWCGMAAATIAAVGITTISIKSPPKQIASEEKSESTSKIAKLNEVSPPQIPEAIRNKTTQPRLNQTLSSEQRLPSPPAVNAPKPKPDIPDPANYSFAELEKQSDLSNQTRANPTPIKQTETAAINNKNRSVTSKKAQTNNSPSDNSQVETLILEPTQTPDKSQQQETEILASENEAAASEELATSGLSNTFNLPQAASDSNLDSQHRQPSQSAQIKAYFQDRWQPPADLKQSLEYRLYLNDNGSIKKVIPLGKASRLYLSKTNIPVQGEKFISPVIKENKENIVIRLLLNPDGGVKTFQE